MLSAVPGAVRRYAVLRGRIAATACVSRSIGWFLSRRPKAAAQISASVLLEEMDDLALYLLLEQNDDDEILQLINLRKSNVDINPIFKQRHNEGCFSTLINRHLLEDEVKFREYFRLNKAQFNYILDLIKDDIKSKSYNRVQCPISPEEQLAITMRFMATGETFRSLAFTFRVSHSYISGLVKKTLASLRRHLVPIFMASLSLDEKKLKAKEFGQKWNFPNCLGAVDGKHIRIRCPSRSGSLFYNYKEFFSIVLLAVVDLNCKFIFIDVGSYGKEGDSGIFDKSKIGQQVREGSIFPPPNKLPNSDQVLPYIFVGDEAFRLSTHMMKPFPRPVANTDERKAIFNYRLSRARRVSENAFGLMSQIFRVFYTIIDLNPATVDDLIIVACCLHNLLRDAFLEATNKPFHEVDQELLPSKTFIPIARGGGFADADGFYVRELFKEYFNSAQGNVPWQNTSVRRTDL